MANDRNAGRKLKYGEPLKQLIFLCPESKTEALREHVRAFLDKLIVGADKGFKCGCMIENGLLRRVKGSDCKLTKEQHGC